MVALDIFAGVTHLPPSPVPSDVFKLCELASAARAYHLETREPALFCIGCRRWSCPICGPAKRRQLVQQIKDAAPTKFITLTCRHEVSPEHQGRKIAKALPRLMTELREAGITITYLRMLETCKDGYPHFHLLARSPFIATTTSPACSPAL